MDDGETASGDPVERIEDALASLRHGGRPPWGGHRGGPEGPFGPGGPGAPHRHGGPHGGPLGGRPHEPADADAAGPTDARGAGRGRRGPRPPWEFRVGPVARARLLATLDGEDRAMSVTELASAVGVDQPRASRLVQAAVDDGLVVREADPDDARRTRIRITDAGRSAVRTATMSRRRAIEAALEGFSDDERAQLAELLARFAEGLHRAHR